MLAVHSLHHPCQAISAACEARGSEASKRQGLLSARRDQAHHFHFGEACSRSCNAKASAACAASLNCLRSSAHSSPFAASLPPLALSLSISLPSSSKRRCQLTVAPAPSQAPPQARPASARDRAAPASSLAVFFRFALGQTRARARTRVANLQKQNHLRREQRGRERAGER